MTYDEAAQITWARVPHFFGTPYYVYQYATCYASSAQLIQTDHIGHASRSAGKASSGSSIFCARAAATTR